MHRAPPCLDRAPLVVSVASLACPPPCLISVVCALLVVSVACAQRPPRLGHTDSHAPPSFQSRRSHAPPSSRSHAPPCLGQLNILIFLARSYTPFVKLCSVDIVLTQMTLVCPSA